MKLPQSGGVVSENDGGSISPLWCFSTCHLSQRFNALKSLAPALRMPTGRVLEVVMKKGFLNRFGKVLAPAALFVAMAVSPVAALAASHGGGHSGGFGGGHGGSVGGGHSFAAPSRGNSGGGRAYSAPARGNFNRGNVYGGGRGFYGGGYYGGRGYYGGQGYYGPGLGFGVGVYAPYGYAAPVCNPAGFYDQYGNWQYYPGCAVPYGY